MKTSEKAAVTQPEPSMKRSIQMKMFATKVQQAEVALAREKGEPEEKWKIGVGQIVGRIFEVNERENELPDGQMKTSLVAVGEFEAVIYGTGEVMESITAYLPGYYLESVRGALKQGAGAVVVGIEVVLTATGKGVPYAYEVRNLVPREADNPINRVKALLAKTGRLRLPPPQELPVLDKHDPEHEPSQEPTSQET